jgi:tRNA-specific 2-thiouridylase
VRLEPETRRIVVGPKAALGRRRFALHGVNWLGTGDAPPGDGIDVSVKIRSTQPPVGARVCGTGDGGASVTLAEPEAAVAPGQACVFYDGTRVLGGGWIAREP